jgi:hypothetical protein
MEDDGRYLVQRNAYLNQSLGSLSVMLIAALAAAIE